MTTNKKKSKDVPSYIISYIMDDEEDSAICEKTDDAKSVKPNFTWVTEADADASADADDWEVKKEATTKDIKKSVSKKKSTDNIVLGEVGTYYVDQSGNFYRQTTKNCLVQIDEEPPAETKCKKFTLPTIPKDKTPNATESSKKANTRLHKKNIQEKKENDEDIEYVFMLYDNSIDEVEEDIDTDDPLTPGTKADEETRNSKSKPKVVQVVVNKNCNNANSEAKETIYACNYCDYSSYKASALSKHIRRHLSSGIFNCSICERSFKTKASLVNHVNAHMGLKPHECKHCSMSFTTAGEVVRHTRYKHTGEKPHKCPDCDYSSVELSKLRRHIRSHTGERPYQCPHCTYASPDTFKLKRHLRTHTGEKPYECDICLARFTQSNSLKSHRLIHSVGDKPVFQCEYCPTTCGRKTDLRAHVFYLHTSDKPIPCKRCTQELPDRWSYKIHLKTHIGEKSFKCEICPYASTSQRHLDSHMMVHKGVKPFVCELCELPFRQPALLKRHMNLYHTTDYKAPQPKEKLHSCPHCHKRFTHNGNLMRHLEMHDPNSNMVKKKKELQIGRRTRINSDGNLIIEELEKPYEKSASNAEEEEDESREFVLIDEKLSNENIDEESVLKFEINSDDLTLRPITSKTSKSKSDIKTFLIDERCESPKTDIGTENSKIMVLRVINYPDDEFEVENDEQITHTNDKTKSESCLSYKIEFDNQDEVLH